MSTIVTWRHTRKGCILNSGIEFIKNAHGNEYFSTMSEGGIMGKGKGKKFQVGSIILSNVFQWTISNWKHFPVYCQRCFAVSFRLCKRYLLKSLLVPHWCIYHMSYPIWIIALHIHCFLYIQNLELWTSYLTKTAILINGESMPLQEFISSYLYYKKSNSWKYTSILCILTRPPHWIPGGLFATEASDPIQRPPMT